MQAVVARHLSSSMQIESLWKHNAKYRPAGSPASPCTTAASTSCPRRSAVARAESFWELPIIGRFLQPAPAATEVDAEAPLEPVSH